jgi:hypothetical protein
LPLSKRRHLALRLRVPAPPPLSSAPRTRAGKRRRTAHAPSSRGSASILLSGRRISQARFARAAWGMRICPDPIFGSNFWTLSQQKRPIANQWLTALRGEACERDHFLHGPEAAVPSKLLVDRMLSCVEQDLWLPCTSLHTADKIANPPGAESRPSALPVANGSDGRCHTDEEPPFEGSRVLAALRGYNFFPKLKLRFGISKH